MPPKVVEPEKKTGWAAAQLDFERVRELFEQLAPSALGCRAVRELEPRDEDGSNAAYVRQSELSKRFQAGETPPLAGATDPRMGLSSAREFRRPLERQELVDLQTFLRAEDRLREWIGARARILPACRALVRTLPDLAAVRDMLTRCVDERGDVVASASAVLLRLRAEITALDMQIASTFAELFNSATLRSSLSDGATHRRAGRRVLAIKARNVGKVPGLVHDRSQSGETVFVEPNETLEAGNRLTALEDEARGEEQRVLAELTRELLDQELGILQVARGWGEIELAWIAVQFCERYGGSVPEVVPAKTGKGLLLRGVRHPLLIEQQLQGALKEVVPIDVRLGAEFDILVITGPNTGGKTLALKTVAVAAWSVRMGLPVCCSSGSRVPFYADVLADIGDGQEIRQNLSTFASHLTRVRESLELASPETLVLLDELGGGTDPEEGAAFSYALLEHLLAIRAPTLVTTHIGKLKELAFRNARAENASVAFDAGTRKPLYRLLTGTPGESNALAIAAELGLPEELLARAHERLVTREADVEELMAELRGAREHAELLRSSAEARLEEIEQAKEKAFKREFEMTERGEKLEAEAQRELEERIAGARRALIGARNLLEQLPSKVAAALLEVLGVIDKELSGAALSERRKEFLFGLSKGQLVYVPRYKQRCLIQRLDRAKKRLEVLVGKMKVEISFDDVTWFEGL